ncbi:thermonuclease family protein [Anaerotalea alkaliphila]|uniref:thermonuclease family protein n=1 Tax=Anaerotalea alkaliphila TaxID=2662126 RepID=UPI0031B5BD3C
MLGVFYGGQASGLHRELLAALLGMEAAYGPLETGVVARVVDGDTILVRLGGGEEVRVRLIGVDTPESVGRYASDPEPYGKEAAAFTRERLEGRVVHLEKDVSDTDRYGRLLRYVWTGKPESGDWEEDMFNAVLVKEGYARVATFPPDVKMADRFLELERTARKGDKGLWAFEP